MDSLARGAVLEYDALCELDNKRLGVDDLELATLCSTRMASSDAGGSKILFKNRLPMVKNYNYNALGKLKSIKKWKVEQWVHQRLFITSI